VCVHNEQPVYCHVTTFSTTQNIQNFGLSHSGVAVCASPLGCEAVSLASRSN